jgi:hypothetical protein
MDSVYSRSRRLPFSAGPPPVQPDSGAASPPICAKDSLRHRKNGFCDPLVLPADQDDTGQLIHVLDEVVFIADAVFGNRMDMQAVAQRNYGLERPLAARAVPRCRLLGIGCVDDMRRWEVGTTQATSEQHAPSAGALPAAHDKGMLVLLTFRGQSPSEIGTVRVRFLGMSDQQYRLR